MKRDYSVEIFRCVMMFFICWLHATSCADVVCVPQVNILLHAVPAFVLISGYFGIEFRWSKILRLWATVFFARRFRHFSEDIVLEWKRFHCSTCFMGN
jgi:hypothetical protein